MKQEKSDRTWRRITNPTAANILMDVNQIRYLKPFLGDEATVGKAAERLGISNDDMYYRVKRLERLGLIEVTRAEARAGKALKYYSVVADGLFVPFSVTPAETLAALLLATDTMLETTFTQSFVKALRETVEDPESWGFRIFKDDDDHTHLEPAPEEAPDDWNPQSFLLKPHSPAVLSDWTDMQLSRGDAKELQRKLMKLLEEYHEKSLHPSSDEPSRTYLLRLALTPIG